jgi:hypothetical protein
MQRRQFLSTTFGAAASAFALPALNAFAAIAPSSVPLPRFPNSDPRWKNTWDAALAVLVGNVKVVPHYNKPVLLEGSVYPGIWQECAPQEGLVYSQFDSFVPPAEGVVSPLAVARNNHMAFFALQREDGQLPCSVKMSETGYGQIQMVVPIAATAWELAHRTGDSELQIGRAHV